MGMSAGKADCHSAEAGAAADSHASTAPLAAAPQATDQASAASSVTPKLPAASGKRETKRDSLVDAEGLCKSQGSIAVAGRYTLDRKLLDDYTLDSKVVGSGMSGPVQLATCIEDKRKVAIKSFKKDGLSEKKRNELKSEVEIYLRLDHPHVARLDRVYETDDEIHLVMEYCSGGELYDRLSAAKKYTEEDAAKTAYQMLLAVGYLHAHDIAHRDLKLENFLYEAKTGEFKDQLKIIDFGFAKFWDHSTKMSQACGSVHYVAPEVLQHAYTPKADMWSLGVIVYMLLTGSPPFFGSDAEVLKKIRAGQPHWSSRFQKLSEPAKHFVKRLLVLSPDERYSAEQALQDPFILGREGHETPLDSEILGSLRTFGVISSFKRAVLTMMAWSLDTEDRAELRQMFLSMDKDNSGTITLAEMKGCLEENFNIGHSEAERIFKSIDKNNDQEIAYSEFLAAACIGRVTVHEDLLRKTFARFDVEKTGRVSVANLEAILGDEFEGIKVTKFIEQVDTDGDGSIDYEEFITYFHKHEHELDELDELPDANRDDRKRHTEQIGKVIDRLARAQTTPFADGPSEESPTGLTANRFADSSPTKAAATVLSWKNGKAASFCGSPTTSAAAAPPTATF